MRRREAGADKEYRLTRCLALAVCPSSAGAGQVQLGQMDRFAGITRTSSPSKSPQHLRVIPTAAAPGRVSMVFRRLGH
jgi:hypothetical protein